MSDLGLRVLGYGELSARLGIRKGRVKDEGYHVRSCRVGVYGTVFLFAAIHTG